MSVQGSERAMTQTIEERVLQLGPAVGEEAVVIGSSAVYMAMPETTRTPQDVDISISEAVYRHLRDQPGWTETVLPDGRCLLANGCYDLELSSKVSWMFDDLKNRSWQTPGGVRIASLPDMYARKQNRDLVKDREDTARIRERLHDPEKPPLSERLMHHELEVARMALPEHLRDAPEIQPALRLAANGLLCVSTLYGDARIGRANQIIGDLELPEYQVAATYHNGFGLPRDMYLLQRHLDNLDVSDEERLLVMAADTYSDIIYGNGRMRHNPAGYDELRSANLLVAHARQLLGPDQAREQRLRDMVLGTAFDEKTYQQAGTDSPDPLVRAVTGIDLQAFAEPESVEAAFDIIVEDGMSARAPFDRILGRTMIQHGVRIDSVAGAMAFIDKHPSARPENAPQGPSIKEFLISRLVDSADFRNPIGGYTPPSGWTLDRPQLRSLYGDRLRQLAALLLMGEATASEAYEQAQEYTEKGLSSLSPL